MSDTLERWEILIKALRDNIQDTQDSIEKLQQKKLALRETLNLVCTHYEQAKANEITEFRNAAHIESQQ